jgi:hypothetical protein
MNKDEQSGLIKTVGGHAENFSVQDGFLIKSTNRTEGRFYEHITKNNFSLGEYIPECLSVEYNLHDKKASRVKLKDLRANFKAPLIYDIKLGTHTVSAKELRASGCKKSNIVRKDIRLHMADNIMSSARRGYRFVGCSTLDDSRRHLGTHPDNMLEHMVNNLSARDLSLIIIKLNKLYKYLLSKEGRRFEFIGASVLILSESALLGAKEQAIEPEVKLIDFAHSSIVGPRGFVLDNGILHTARRKRLYQKGLRDGIAHLIHDLEELSFQKPL